MDVDVYGPRIDKDARALRMLEKREESRRRKGGAFESIESVFG